MLVTRKSQLTGEVHTMDIPCTEFQLWAWEHGGWKIQKAMPDVSTELREFVISGITPEEWEKAFGTDEDM